MPAFLEMAMWFRCHLSFFRNNRHISLNNTKKDVNFSQRQRKRSGRKYYLVLHT